jgi:serine/threonine protein kinase
MGEVYEARDTRLDRTVAIKVLPAEVAEDTAARARFDREARAIAALNHPNICALHDIGDADGHGYLVMERLEGQTLQDRLQRGPLDVEQTLDYGIALADALDAAHGRGLIHRDLKPANIFITTRGVVKILDFGLAKSVQETDADVTRSVNDALTSTGTTLGTVAYMSPEQLRGEPLDVRTDLFSFGLVLYEMATGERAFPGSTVVVTAAGILNQQPRTPRTIRADLPVRLEQVILRALEKDRALRYRSAADLRADLILAQRDPRPAMPAIPALPTIPPIPTAVPSQPARQSERPRSRRRWRALAIPLVIVIVSSAGKWIQSIRHGSRQPVQETSASIPSEPESTPRRPSFPAAPAPPPEAVEPPPGAFAEPPAVGRGLLRVGRAIGAGGANLVTLLRAAPPETYDLVYASNDPEAMAIALQIRGVLEGAGWRNASTVEIPEPAARLGIFTPRMTPGVRTLTTWASRSGLQPDPRTIPTLPRPRIVIGKQDQP